VRCNGYQSHDPAPRQIPAPDAIDRALDLLGKAKKPLIILGKGAA